MLRHPYADDRLLLMRAGVSDDAHGLNHPQHRRNNPHVSTLTVPSSSGFLEALPTRGKVYGDADDL